MIYSYLTITVDRTLILQRNVRQLATNISPENVQNAYKMGFSMPKIECKKAENTNLAL